MTSLLPKHRTLPLLLLLCVWPATLAAGDAPKAIILGFDGIDPSLTQHFFEQGELPNLKRLADLGGFKPLQTVYPAQSPVCWASALTGLNPGKHGVVGFVRRKPGTYSPELGIVRVEERTVLSTVNRVLIAGAAALLFMVLMLGAGKLARSKAIRIITPMVGLTGGALVVMFLTMVPTTVPQPVNARQGATFHETIATAGHKVVSLNTPMDWPVQRSENLEAYAGFNVPDLRGTFGIYSFYTDQFHSGTQGKTEMGGDVYRVEWQEGESSEFCTTEMRGMRDISRARDGYPTTTIPLTITRHDGSGSVAVAEDISTELSPGKWSEWIETELRINPLVGAKTRLRFYCESLEPLKLYATPLQFDPVDPAGDNSLDAPRGFFASLEEKLGEKLPTLGWPELTHPVYDENMTDSVFMDHLLKLEERRADVMFALLEEGGRDLIASYFYGSDRVQHIMWRYIDKHNSNYEVLLGSPEAKGILKIYQFMDRVVGRVLEKYCDHNTLLMVVSDHGFAPFRRAVSLNRWLRDQGYLFLKGDQTKRKASDMFDGDARDALLHEVDWSRTRAYALGLGKIFLNVEGREPQGIVDPDEAEMLAGEIKHHLEQLRDPGEGNRRVVSRALLRDQIVHGPYSEEMCDILVGFYPGYRVSWQTTLGFAGEEVIFENDRRWSADHCSIDSELLPGVIFTNRRFATGEVGLMDIAPTLLQHFELPIDALIDGLPMRFKAKKP